LDKFYDAMMLKLYKLRAIVVF